MHPSLRFTLRAAGLVGLLLLIGCIATSTLRPPGLPPISLTEVDSARDTLHQVRLEERAGRLLLCGYVFRHYPAATEDTSATRLLLTLFKARDEPQRDLLAEFTPRQIPLGARRSSYSVYFDSSGCVARRDKTHSNRCQRRLHPTSGSPMTAAGAAIPSMPANFR